MKLDQMKDFSWFPEPKKYKTGKKLPTNRSAHLPADLTAPLGLEENRKTELK